VAYAYNDPQLAAPPTPDGNDDTIPSVSPDDRDLLWGEMRLVPFGSTPIHIKMGHRFMRFRHGEPLVSVGEHEPELTDFVLEKNYTGQMTVASGVVVPDVSLGPLDLTDTYQMVYPAQANNGTKQISVRISGSINNYNFSDQLVTFTKALQYGGSYTLQLHFWRGCRFAGSNIYWKWNDPEDEAQGGYLTFELNGVPIDDARQRYQGVFFKWGSLVGISPQRVDPTLTGTYLQTNPYIVSGAYAPRYAPTYNATEPENSTWAKLTTALGWDQIPSFYNISFTVGGERADSFADKTTTEYPNQRGDICRYLGHTNPALAGYRMPTLVELLYGGYDSFNYTRYVSEDWEISPPVGNRWTRMGDASAWAGDAWAGVGWVDSPHGTYQVPVGAYFGLAAMLPASGKRASDGLLRNVANLGHYWSSSAKIDGGDRINYAFSILMSSGGVQIANDVRQNAHSVRCVLDE
jgi:hypothetical protein